jgi:hypothetical protein
MRPCSPTTRIPAVGSRTSKGLCTCQLKPHHQRPAYGRALQTSSKQDGRATSAAGWASAFALLPLPAPAFGVQFKAAPYRLRTAIHRLPISSCGAAANVAPHFHKAAALTGWCRSHSRMAAYLHGIRSFRVSFRSNAVAVSPLVMHISATTVNDRIMRLLALPPPLDLTSVLRPNQMSAEKARGDSGFKMLKLNWSSLRELAKCLSGTRFDGLRGRKRNFLSQHCELLGLLAQRFELLA